MPHSGLPHVLSIAGTDPSGGAGIHADLKTFTARNTLGTTVITALVAQNTHGVSRVYPLDLDFIQNQFDAVLSDMPIAASKAGMLGNTKLVELVAQQRQQYDLGFFTLDPVMVSTSGHRLLEPDAITTLRDTLLPVADLITPNLPEAALLLGHQQQANNLEQMQQQAQQLLQLGPKAVLLKGGHGHNQEVFNVLLTADGEQRIYRHARIDTANTHGTGCTLSAAITAEIAHLKQQHSLQQVSGDYLAVAIANALHWLYKAIRSAQYWQVSLHPEGAHGPVNHQVDIHPHTPFHFPLTEQEITL